jgi:hypothetical protein
LDVEPVDSGGTRELLRNFFAGPALNKAPVPEREANVTTATAPSAAPLTAVDRCDRCGAQAYLRVSLQGGGELLFCAHHAREHGDKLREIAAYVHDETDKLAETPAVTAEDEH